VHESADPENPYDHTHALFKWAKRVDTCNPRFFDLGPTDTIDHAGHDIPAIPAGGGVEEAGAGGAAIGGGTVPTGVGLGSTGRRITEPIHPNIQGISTILHEKNAWTYHEKEGNARTKSERGPIADENFIDRLIAANSLSEAVALAGIEIRSVNDINLLRCDVSKQALHEHLWTKDQFNLQLEDGWKCLYVHGPSGFGKTQWALAQFDSPLFVRRPDQLRDFDPRRHDGIVFDDMEWEKADTGHFIHLTDWDMPSHIKCRYRDAFIPAKTRKIFTSNKAFEEYFPPDPAGAIARRVKRIQIKSRLFNARGEGTDAGHPPRDDAGTRDEPPRSPRLDRDTPAIVQRQCQDHAPVAMADYTDGAQEFDLDGFFDDIGWEGNFDDSFLDI